MGNYEEQREALKAYQKESLEQSKSKKEKWKKIRKRIVLVVVIYSILSIFFYVNGLQITLPIPVELDEKYYDIRLNNQQVSIINNMNYKKAILPFLIYIENGNSGILQTPNAFENPYIKEEPYLLTIKSYSCYNNENRKRIVPCYPSYNKYTKENKKEKYTMIIYKYKHFDKQVNYEDFISGTVTRKLNELEEKEFIKFSYASEYEEIYNGNFIEDITKLISTEGVYGIKVMNKQKSITTTLKFGLINNGRYIYIKTKENKS